MGSSGSGTTTNLQKFEPPEWLQPAWQSYVNSATGLASQDYTQFQGPRQAEMNSLQTQGLYGMADRAANGAPDLNAARAGAMGTVNGQYLGQGPGATSNVQPGTNPLMNNQYVEDVIGRNANNMASAMANGTAAQTDSLAARKGAFGGSGNAYAQSLNAGALSKSVGDMSGQLRMDDLNTRRNLQEAQIGRQFSADQFNTSTQQGAFNSERDRQLAAGRDAGTFSQDDWTGWKNMIGAGDAFQNQEQKGLDANVDEFNRQQMDPYQKLDVFANAISRASGTGGTNTSSIGGGGGDMLSQLLGGAGAAYGFSRLFS